MKILQINAVYGIGSTGKIVESIHRELLRQGEESYVAWAIESINAEPEECFYHIGNYFDHKVHALLRRIDLGQGFHSIIATKNLLQFIYHIRPDIIHLHNLHSNYIDIKMLFRLCNHENIPIVLSLHDCWFFTGYCMHYQEYGCSQWKTGCEECPAVHYMLSKRVKRLFNLKAIAYGDLSNIHIIGVSQWTENAVRSSKLLGGASSITHIHNWVDVNMWHATEERGKTCERYGIDKNKKIVLGVSQGWSMSGTKGGSFFVTFAERHHNEVEVVLVGKNNDLPETPGLHCIGFTSSKQELANLYSIADVYVTPSRQETFGLTVIEAMACGTPVVAYDNTALHELINATCGVLVPDGNEEKMQSEVFSVLRKGKEPYTEMCREYITQNFEEKIQVGKYINVYKKVWKS